LLRRLAQAHVTGVDRDAAVLDMAHAHFHLPPPSSRLALVVDDALRYVCAATTATVDVLLVDLCTPRLPEGAAAPAFLASARRRLRPGGVFCANHYAQRPQALAAQHAALAEVFGWVHASRVAPDNVVFFALPDGLPARTALAARAEALEPALQLGLPAFVAGLPTR
jgi:spermidine synthase